ncbi:hypothetical protein B9Z55_018450 [Caenorhabditis nigoni]|uniref:Uncharacterized protein n=1 Tax=Caenorhabditis nigoni TaxID=1611254 RepID=A0A2G5TE71_9PELO|nr:hypothetical protein B9Z55_018450 [Caenorhabditis nigoni]
MVSLERGSLLIVAHYLTSLSRREKKCVGGAQYRKKIFPKSCHKISSHRSLFDQSISQVRRCEYEIEEKNVQVINYQK